MLVRAGGLPATEHLVHALLGREDESLDVGVGRRWEAMKASRAVGCVGCLGEDALGDERVSVRPDASAVREALDLEHAAGLRLGDAGVLRLRALPSGDLVGEGTEHVAGQGRVEGDDPRDVARQSQNEARWAATR